MAPRYDNIAVRDTGLNEPGARFPDSPNAAAPGFRTEFHRHRAGDGLGLDERVFQRGSRFKPMTRRYNRASGCGRLEAWADDRAGMAPAGRLFSGYLAAEESAGSRLPRLTGSQFPA